MKRLYTVILMALLLPVPATLRAQGADALPFTAVERDPVNVSLAGAGLARAEGSAYKAFSGAAMLPFMEGTLDAALSWQLRSPASARTNNIHAGVTYRVSEKLVVSAGYVQGFGKAFPGMGELGQPAGTVKPASGIVALGAGMALGENLGLGLNLRYATEKDVDARTGFSADVSAAWRPLEALTLSAAVSTLGTAVVSEDGTRYAQPACARLGADWAYAPAQDHALDLMAGAEVYFSGQWGAALGFQYGWKQQVFVRGGYRLASEWCVVPSHLALGAGYRFGSLRLDVSWLTASKAIGNTLSAGIAYNF